MTISSHARLLLDRTKGAVAGCDVIPPKYLRGLEKEFGSLGQSKSWPAEFREHIAGGVGRGLQFEDQVEGCPNINRAVALPHLAVARVRPRVRVGAELLIQGFQPAIWF